jgi:pimeloyl-ACP methyl ester carboxylesterase
VPTLVVYARDDQVVPAHMSIDLAARIAGAQTAELAAGGHFAPLIAPEDCAETMIGFVGAA